MDSREFLDGVKERLETCGPDGMMPKTGAARSPVVNRSEVHALVVLGYEALSYRQKCAEQREALDNLASKMIDERDAREDRLVARLEEVAKSLRGALPLGFDPGDPAGDSEAERSRQRIEQRGRMLAVLDKMAAALPAHNAYAGVRLILKSVICEIGTLAPRREPTYAYMLAEVAEAWTKRLVASEADH